MGVPAKLQRLAMSATMALCAVRSLKAPGLYAAVFPLEEPPTGSRPIHTFGVALLMEEQTACEFQGLNALGAPCNRSSVAPISAPTQACSLSLH